MLEKKVKKFIQEKDKLAALLGIELIEVTKGQAHAKMTIKPCHLNGVGMVHGGAIFSLADITFAAASNSHGTIAVAINTEINFIKAAHDGVLFAHAREIACNRHLSTCVVDITDETGTLIAHFTGLAYRKDIELNLE